MHWNGLAVLELALGFFGGAAYRYHVASEVRRRALMFRGFIFLLLAAGVFSVVDAIYYVFAGQPLWPFHATRPTP